MFEVKIDDRRMEVAIRELVQRLPWQMVAPALRAAGRVYRDRVREGIAGPPAVVAAGRRTTGFRVDKQNILRVGFGLDRRMEPGHFMSWRCIHWLVLGTAERVREDGRRTGRLQPYLRGQLQPIVTRTHSEALRAGRERLVNTIRKWRAQLYGSSSTEGSSD